MVVVEDVVDIMSRLSEVELVVILKYVVSVIDLLVKNIVFLFCSIRVELWVRIINIFGGKCLW